MYSSISRSNSQTRRRSAAFVRKAGTVILGASIAVWFLLASPVRGDAAFGEAALDDSLFVDDALIFDAPTSRSVRFGAPGEPGIEVAWENLPELGVWTKPGAPYLCIEPWQGFSDPQDFAGEFRDKPGVIEVPPGGERRFAMNVTIEAAT